ncbi:MAG: metallophosphoesterase [Sphingomonas sp.]|uniref:metallophosphoesterase family protein n=1 Tax=Sphingomonas sp. TaxID=28214 RepID=UPI00183DCAF9|nr:metallophosphoesterase [Sphingomonas sp.]MBA3667337.1 metallophosphoesterase [Sphingomonas sp.]
MASFVHLSDLHFGAHDPRLVEAVERRVDEAKPDLVVISGDFTQRARTEQFEEACAFLTRLKDAGHEVLAVPGNHDVPLYDVLRRFLSPLTRYKRYIDQSLCPFIEIGGAAVLGINTARSLTFKNGHVSHEQMDFIRETFARTDPDQPRILVTHHPLFALPVGDGPELGHLMDDQQDALSAIAEAGVDLLLAGHNHRASVGEASQLVHGAGKALVVQAGTATSTRTRDEAQSFNRIEIDGSGVRVTVLLWNGEDFVDSDSEFFERHQGHWKLASGEPVQEAPSA